MQAPDGPGAHAQGLVFLNEFDPRDVLAKSVEAKYLRKIATFVGDFAGPNFEWTVNFKLTKFQTLLSPTSTRHGRA
jgi:hypothetical protein